MKPQRLHVKWVGVGSNVAGQLSGGITERVVSVSWAGKKSTEKKQSVKFLQAI